MSENLLPDEIALVTGASRGIGQAIALGLGRAGAVVIGTATSEAGAAAIGTTLAEAKRYGRNRTFVHEGEYPTPVVPPNLSLSEKQLDL